MEHGDRVDLVGRDGELATLRRRLAAGDPTLISGPTGVGKTSLVGAAVRELGSRPIVVRGTRTGRSMPFAALERHLPPSVTTVRDALAHLRSIVAGSPAAAVVADDAHLLDDASAFVLRALADDGEVAVVATVVDDASLPEHVSLLADACGPDGRIELHELTLGDARLLVERLLGGPTSQRCLRHLHRSTHGNPLELRELVETARRDGSLQVLGGLWEWTGGNVAPRRLADRLNDRLAGLDPDARRLFEIVSLAGSVEAAGVAPLLGLPPERARDVVSALERERLVVVGGPPAFEVGASHPLHAELVVAAMPTLVRQQRAEALALAPVPDDPRRQYVRTQWMLEAGHEVSAGRLTAAALHALERGAVDAAVPLAEAAVAAGGGYRALLVHGTAAMLSGDVDAARASLRAAVDAAERPGGRLAASNQLAGLEFDHGASTEAADAVLDAAGASPFVDARRALHLVLNGRHAAAAELVAAFDGADPQLEFVAAVARSLSATMAGDAESGAAIAHAALETRSSARAAVHLPTVNVLAVAATFAHREHGDLEAARRLAATWYDTASRDDDRRGQGWHALMLGNVELATGAYAAAGDWFREAVVQFARTRYPPVRWAYAGVALAAAMAGAPLPASAALAELDALGPSCWTFLDHEIARARAWTAMADGDATGAVELLVDALPAGAAGTTRGVAAPARRALLLDLVRMGHAPTVPIGDGPLEHVIARHAEALETCDASRLATVADEYRARGLAGAATDTLVRAAIVAHAAGEHDAIDHARAARALAGTLDSPAWSLRLLAERVGASARQVEIGRHAAAGESNPEIAARLYLSVRTVENHLAALFRSLRISRRDELPDALTAWFGGAADEYSS